MSASPDRRLAAARSATLLVAALAIGAPLSAQASHRAAKHGAAASAAAAPAAAEAPAGDAAKGEIVFAKCGACHSIKAGEMRVGPSLYGVVGRKAGTLPGYEYSAAMKASGLVWTPKTLDAYLPAPRTMVPGTKMLFVGLANPVDRANVIAYLAKNGATK